MNTLSNTDFGCWTACSIVSCPKMKMLFLVALNVDTIVFLFIVAYVVLPHMG